MFIKGRKMWLILALLVGSGTVHAGSGVRMYEHGEVPQASEVADILSGADHTRQRPKMRGIRLDDYGSGERRMETGLASVAEPQNTAIGLPVEFAFNSAEIAPAYVPQLDAIAEGIKMAGGVSVIVEGHTDAHGPEAYNKNLSVKRAEVVRRYLVEKHGIGGKTLMIKGLGESQPIDTDNPFASRNRRVQFRASK